LMTLSHSFPSRWRMARSGGKLSQPGLPPLLGGTLAPIGDRRTKDEVRY
jgi:hypothetical protein